MSAANDRPEDDPNAPAAAGDATTTAPRGVVITSALRPRAVGPSPEPLAPEASGRVLACVAEVMASLAPAANETQVVDAFAAVMVELLPGRSIALRVEPLTPVDSRVAANQSLAAASPGERSSHVTLAAAGAVEVPVYSDGALVAVIAIARTGADADDALARGVAGAVAPFLASALRVARAGSDAVAQLDRLQSQLVQADRLVTIGRYTAEIVHEFNNPLSAIVAYSDLLAQRPGFDGPDRARMERIGEAATRVQGLARRLLAYARATPEPAGELPIAEVLDQAVVFCEHVVAQHGALIERVFDEQLPGVYGVRAELVQVFVNLITNACHAVGPRNGRVVITARVLAEQGVCVTVEDNGHGIEARHLPHIFDPFFTTKVESAGTGLGLSIVRYILEGHGARWRVDSEPGRGTRFEIDLPLARR